MQSWQSFVERVAQRFGNSEPDELKARVRATLVTLGKYIPEIDRKHFELPAEAAEHLGAHPSSTEDFDLDTIAALLGMPPGEGREFVLCVLAAIDESQVGEARQHWLRNLPEEVAEALPIEKARRPESKTGPAGHTLADGRAGSRRPIATSSDTQHDSATSDHEPHGDTKLSTAKGTTQERLGRTLAEGKPGSSRSLADEDGD